MTNMSCPKRVMRYAHIWFREIIENDTNSSLSGDNVYHCMATTLIASSEVHYDMVLL